MTLAVDIKVFDAQGQELSLGSELGRGGEATVFSLSNEPSKVVKLYHQPSETRIKKLEAMIANAPQDPTAGTEHLSLAWPQNLVFDGIGQGVGFIMPYIDNQNSLPLHQLYNPKARRQRAAGITWHYLVRIARNLCAVVAALHRAGYVIGDLNESNILVTDRALVSLVDCDSVQVRDGPKLYRCLVGKGEYTAPELQDKAFQTVTRRPKHDTFALAVLLFLLLMEGVHPFAGVYRGEGEPPSTVEAIRSRRSAFFGAGMLEPAPGAPAFDSLPREIRGLFRRAFSTRFNRPSATGWQGALEKLGQNLLTCNVNGQHCHSAHLKSCPWCERTAMIGLEAFPPLTQGSTVRQGPNALEQRKLPMYFRGGLWSWLKSFFVTASLMMMLSGVLAYSLSLLGNSVEPAYAFSRPLFLVGVFLVSISFSILVGYSKTRATAQFYKRLKRLETLVRATLGASLIALTLSFLIGTFTGSGNVFEGDWLLLPSIWLISFWLVWRRFRPT